MKLDIKNNELGEGLYSKIKKIDSAQRKELDEMEQTINKIMMILSSKGFKFPSVEKSSSTQGYDLLVNDLGQNAVTMLSANQALSAISDYLID